MSALATAGVAAWVVPEILTAKPAAGAPTLSGSGPVTSPGSPGTGGTTGSGGGTDGTSGVPTAAPTPPSGPTSGVTISAATTQPSGPTSGVTTAAATQPSGPLAYSGLNIERDAQVGAALIAGGWAMHHWASRTQDGRPTE
jgi:hypothetical protein